MCLFHYLTIGRFEFVEEEAPPDLVQRVLDHFTPGGLTRLGRAARIIEPFKREEIREIEEEVKRRFGLELNLGEYLREDGLLQIMYMAHAAFESFAEHVALVVSERFGTIASDRGRVYEPAKIKEMSQGLIIRVLSVKDLPKSRMVLNGFEKSIRLFSDRLRILNGSPSALPGRWLRELQPEP